MVHSDLFDSHRPPQSFSQQNQQLNLVGGCNAIKSRDLEIRGRVRSPPPLPISTLFTCSWKNSRALEGALTAPLRLPQATCAGITKRTTLLFASRRALGTPRAFCADQSTKGGVAPARFCSLNPAAFETSSLCRGVFKSFTTPLGEDLGTGRCAV